MKLPLVRNTFRFFAAAVIGLSSLAAVADDRAITIIVPYPAGGGTDTVARNLGRLLQPELNQSIVVENITGAGSRIATQNLMRSAPDGLRLLLSASDITINQALRKSPPWNIDKDFTHIAIIGNAPIVYVSSTKVPAANLREFVDYARQQAGKGTPLNYGSGGIGSILHLPTLELAAKYKLEMTHIPYRGAVPLVQDLSAGLIEFGVVNPVNAVGRDDKIRALAITGSKRHPMIPNVPTTTEAGFPDLNTTSFVEIIGPAKMPQATVDRLVAALKKVSATEAFRTAMLNGGIDPGWAVGADLQKVLQDDLKKWQDLSRVTGVALED
jgi:tripartite-type tricarboxylate transporter receptor subunit TctC